MSIASISLAPTTTRPDLPTRELPASPQVPEGSVVVRRGATSPGDVVALPRPETVETRDERPSIDPQHFRRLLNKGLRRLARGVRNELRQVSRELDLDRSERRELRRDVRSAYRDFRSELRDAFRAARSEDRIDSDQLVGTIRSSFRGLIADIKQIVSDAASRPGDEIVEQPVEAEEIVEQPTTQPETVTAPVTTPDPVTRPPEGAVTIAVGRSSSSTAVTSSQESPDEAPQSFEDAVASPFVTRASSFIESYRAVVTRVEGPDGQVRVTSSYSYESTTYDYYA